MNTWLMGKMFGGNIAGVTWQKVAGDEKVIKERTKENLLSRRQVVEGDAARVPNSCFNRLD